MKFKQLHALAASFTLALYIVALPVLQAHAAGADTVASGSAISKQEMQGQKKAERKARRAKKNAELSSLEKNGYNPAANQVNYPQNMRSAQQNTIGQKTPSVPQ